MKHCPGHPHASTLPIEVDHSI
uniref:Uncharacterized protein n=1 Tax=Arundo donax TaxID=35708 RepID=A0A0A9C680_ARUDO